MSFRPAGFYDSVMDDEDDGCGFDFGDDYEENKLVCDVITATTPNTAPKQFVEEGQYDDDPDDLQLDRASTATTPSLELEEEEMDGGKEINKSSEHGSSSDGGEEDQCITMETVTDDDGGIVPPVERTSAGIKSGETSPTSDQSDCSDNSPVGGGHGYSSRSGGGKGDSKKNSSPPVMFKISSDEETVDKGENNGLSHCDSLSDREGEGKEFPHQTREEYGKQQEAKLRLKGQVKLLELAESLKVAIVRGNLEQVEKILDEGVDPNSPLSTGWPPLLHACDSCQETVVNLLMGRGVSADTNRDYLTALMVVCMNKKPSLREKALKCAQILLDHGAKVNTCDRHRMNPLLYACQTGQTGLAKLLISSNADVNSSDVKGWTPLFFAASKGHTSLLKILVTAGSNPKAVSSEGETPFTVAYSGGHTAAADWLESIESEKPSHGNRISLDNQYPSHPTSNTPSGQALTSAGSGHYRDDGDITGVGCILGDLEMFLMGLQLKELIPIFHDHKVEFGQLLSMTDFDLRLMGVSQVGARKKILSGILEVHKKEWTMPEAKTALPYSRPISSAELTVIVTNLARHALYLRGSAHFVLTHLKSDLDLLGPHVESEEVRKLSSGLGEVVEATRTLRSEVEELKALALENLPASSLATPTTSVSGRGPLLLKAILGVGTLSCVSLGLYHFLKQQQ